MSVVSLQLNQGFGEFCAKTSDFCARNRRRREFWEFSVHSDTQKSKGYMNGDGLDEKVIIDKTRGLCSYYAEKGGLMIGFEVN